MTLTEFLAARLDEDAMRADVAFDRYGDDEWPRDLTHVLREVEAKRAIVAEHPMKTELSDYEQSSGKGESFGCEVCHEWDGIITGDGYCPTLHHLAAVYADHPDYREEWRP